MSHAGSLANLGQTQLILAGFIHGESAGGRLAKMILDSMNSYRLGNEGDEATHLPSSSKLVLTKPHGVSNVPKE